MSRRAILLGAISGLTLAAHAAGVAAQQDTSDRERQIVEQLDRLHVHYQELREASRTLDSVLSAQREASMRIEVDTAFVGPFLVVAVPEQLNDAVEVFSAAWSQLEDVLSGWSPPETVGLSKDLTVLLYHRTRGAYLGPSSRGVFLRPWHPRSVAKSDALAFMEKRVFDIGMPRGTMQWAPELGLTNRETLEFAYRNLVITPAESARACFEGEADRCWDALGLRNVETSWESWYDDAERRMWAGRKAGVSGLDGVEICPRSTSGCLAFVRERGDAPIPAEPMTRASFLGHALRVGGEGALVRLNAGDETTSLADRLVFASGLSAHELVESWRDQVLATAPPARTGLSLKLLSGALLWSLVLSGFSMRSTRWRA